jgi:hypothetical protein
MFLNKALLVCNIVKLSVTIDGIYCAMDNRLGLYHMKHHRNMVTKSKAYTRELRNMI